MAAKGWAKYAEAPTLEGSNPYPMRYLICCSTLWLLACSTPRRTTTAPPADPLGVAASPVFARAHTGFALYDPAEQEWLDAYQADKYFIPASNTKLLTYYAGLRLLPDTLPALHYYVQGDSLILWGAGHPSLLHPDLPGADSIIINFLRRRPERLFYCPGNFGGERYGAGWAWDDYRYGYQAERSPLPLYGNAVRFRRDSSLRRGFYVEPPLFAQFTELDADLGGAAPRVHRAEFDNRFSYNPRALVGEPFERTVPFQTGAKLTTRLLGEVLEREVQLLNLALPVPPEARTLYAVPAAALYRVMLQQSDNFVAEQLLLAASGSLNGRLDTRTVIDYVLDSLLADLPQEPRWVDGSGLSRYNLTTPRSTVRLLEKIQALVPPETLLATLPAGGVTGTIKNWYVADRPYVFAKTGTLSNNHCLSGYLRTRSGRVLLFSFMHNNFAGPSKPFKEEMQRILERIYQRY